MSDDDKAADGATESVWLSAETIVHEGAVAAEIVRSLAVLPPASRLHVMQIVQVQLNRLEEAERHG